MTTCPTLLRAEACHLGIHINHALSLSEVSWEPCLSFRKKVLCRQVTLSCCYFIYLVLVQGVYSSSEFAFIVVKYIQHKFYHLSYF